MIIEEYIIAPSKEKMMRTSQAEGPSVARTQVSTVASGIIEDEEEEGRGTGLKDRILTY